MQILNKLVDKQRALIVAERDSISGKACLYDVVSCAC
jgi:hypothetical protein